MARSDAAVLKWLDGAAAAAREAHRDPCDADALHRLRVNIRRLLVYAKAVGKPCGVPAKLRKRLRRALRDTGPWRDGHVEALWLRDYARRLPGEGPAALARALVRDAPPAEITPRWWRKLAAALDKTRRAVKRGSSRGRALRAARRAAAEKEWRRLARRLRALELGAVPSTLHAARIAVKRLRYLLETMESVPRGLPAPEDLRGLQAALGEAHDRDVIAAGIAAARRWAALRVPARDALRRLKLEKNARTSCARRCWKPLLAGSR